MQRAFYAFAGALVCGPVAPTEALAQSAAVPLTASDVTACDPGKQAYAAQLGIPCSALGNRVDFSSGAILPPATLGPSTSISSLSQSSDTYSYTDGRVSNAAADVSNFKEVKDNSNVYIYRTGGLIWKAVFLVDGVKVAELPAGRCEYTSLHLEPGQHRLDQRWTFSWIPLSLKTHLDTSWQESRKSYYRFDYKTDFYGRYITAKMTLSAVDPYVAERDLKDCSFHPST